LACDGVAAVDVGSVSLWGAEMTKRDARIVALEMSAALLQAALYHGEVEEWHAVDSGSVELVEEEVDRIAQSLRRRATRLRKGAGR